MFTVEPKMNFKDLHHYYIGIAWERTTGRVADFADFSEMFKYMSKNTKAVVNADISSKKFSVVKSLKKNYLDLFKTNFVENF